MKKGVEIVPGRKGFHLKVNGLFINLSLTNKISSVRSEIGIPGKATEWVSVRAIRDFWNRYRAMIVFVTENPTRSAWTGNVNNSCKS